MSQVQPDSSHSFFSALIRPGYLLGVIVLLAFVLRLILIPYGLPLLLYEDEPIYFDHALGFGLGHWDLGYFKKPGFFLYFYSMFYYLAYLYTPFMSWKAYVDAFWQDPTLVAWVGRMVTVGFATGSVYLLARLGQRAFSPSVGLAAAFLLAVNLVHVRYSPIVISDLPAVFFILAATWFALAVFERGRARDYCACALMIALAMSFKYNVFSIFFLIAAHGLRYLAQRNTATGFSWQAMLSDRRIWISLMLVPVVFLILNPMTLADFPTFWEQINMEKRHMLQRNPDIMDGSWVFMAAFESIFIRILPRSLGWPVYILGLIGIPYMFWRYGLRSLVLWSFSLIFLLVVLQFQLINAKYLLPIYPFWFLAVAILLRDALQRLRVLCNPRWPEASFIFSFALLTLLTAWPVWADTLRYVSLHKRPDTRMLAYEAIQSIQREGDRFLLERETMSLDPKIYRVQILLSDYRKHAYHTRILAPDDLNPERLRRMNPDYVLVNLGQANKRETPDGDIYYEMTSNPDYYDALRRDYRIRNVFSPSPLSVSQGKMDALLSEKGFGALYEAIREGESERTSLGPLLLLLERK